MFQISHPIFEIGSDQSNTVQIRHVHVSDEVHLHYIFKTFHAAIQGLKVEAWNKKIGSLWSLPSGWVQGGEVAWLIANTHQLKHSLIQQVLVSLGSLPPDPSPSVGSFWRTLQGDPQGV